MFSFRNPAEVASYRKKHEITINQGVEVAGNPILNFQEGGFPEYLMNTIVQEKYTEPTPIQAQGWPIVLSGENAHLGFSTFDDVSYFFYP